MVGLPSLLRRTGAVPAILAVLALSGCLDEEAPEPVVRPVRAATVQADFIPDTIQQTGDIRSRDEIPVGFRIGGKVTARPIDIGAVVRPGDLIARLDPEHERSRMRAAAAAVAAARAELVRAGGEESRQRAVIEKGFITRTSYDTALRNLQTARAHLEAAEAELALTEQTLGYTELRAEIEGVVTATGATPGQVVAAGQMVARIARIDEREAVFEIAENLFRRVPRDPVVTVELVGDPDIRTTGRVRYVSPQADPLTRTYTVRVSLPDAPPEMRLGTTIRGHVALPAEPAIALPGPALLEREGRPAVWVFDAASGTVDLRTVAVRRYDAERVIVTDGIEAGDVVVTAGVHTLRPGQRVRLLEAPAR
ncbi:MAG: efflux RND transporter periplasmic adaptor subunit [Alphaproteobacteria bacterium]